MALIQIIQLGPQPSPTDALRSAADLLKHPKGPSHFVLGIQVQDQYAIQITSEWDNSSAQGAENLEEQAALISNLSTLYGKHETAFHVSLDRSVFGPGGLAQAPVVEYVQTWFPTSQVTPDFHRKIESDFSRFDAVYLEGATGHLGLATGWVLEELGHEKITGGEKARCFFVMRGWESMDAFQRAVQHEKYKESIPILFAWEAPFFEMWHVERQASSGI